MVYLTEKGFCIEYETTAPGETLEGLQTALLVLVQNWREESDKRRPVEWVTDLLMKMTLNDKQIQKGLN